MNIIRGMVTFDKSKLEDVPNFMDDQNKLLSRQYDQVLKLAVNQYLGREFDSSIDKDRLKAVTVIDSNVTSYFVDDVLIGTLTTEWGYNEDNVMHNKITARIEFKPVIF